jgi:hypothetical protein
VLEEMELIQKVIILALEAVVEVGTLQVIF